jgi:hypothetical protein
VIGLMPRYVPRFRKRLAVTYTRMRRRQPRRQKEAKRTERVQVETMALCAASDLSRYAPTEFPMATIRPREARGRAVAAVAALRRWVLARWQWFKPRSMPCVVAGLGMLAVIAAADYLAHHIDQPKPEKSDKLMLVDISNR